MANFRLVYRNLMDEVDPVRGMAVTSAVATLPLANIQTTPRELVWRSTSTASQNIQGNYGGLENAAAYFGLHNHLCQGASIRLQLYSGTDSATGQVYDSGTVSIATNVTLSNPTSWGYDTTLAQNTDLLYWEQAFNLWFAVTRHKSWRITISGTPGAYSYFQIGRMFLAPYWEASVQGAYGVPLSWVSNTQRNRSMGGSNRRNRGARWRRFEIGLDFLPEADRAALLDLMGFIGEDRDVVASIFPGDSDARLDRDYTLNGCIVGADPIVIANVPFRSKKFVVEGN